MKIQLSDHFDYKKLFCFVLPSIVMMIFTSIYSVVDGFFVSNFVGKTPFAAVNLIMPVPQILGAIGFMLGTGGSALTAKTLGEKKNQKANEIFSMLVYVGIALGIFLAVIGIVFIRPIAVWLGAKGEMLEFCVTYARILLAALPAFMLQNMFQSFLVTAEKPQLGLIITIAAGVCNMLLDAVFIIVLRWGIAGAAAATALSQLLGGILPLCYFLKAKDGVLKLIKTKIDGSVLFKTCTNGSSEFVTNISMSIVGILYNFQLLKYAGENGVAAYGVIMYVSFIFVAIFIGYSIGAAPIIGYHYGAKNNQELKNIFRKSMIFVTGSGILLTISGCVFADEFARFFVGYDAELLELTIHAFRLYAFSFFFTGFGIFGSALFTSLNNGVVSALISFLRTLVLQTLSILILPAIWGIEGVWYAIIAAEGISAVVALGFIIKYKNYYKY